MTTNERHAIIEQQIEELQKLPVTPETAMAIAALLTEKRAGDKQYGSGYQYMHW